MDYRYYLRAPGFLAQAERWKLYNLATTLRKGSVIINIGVEYGASLVALSQGCPAGNLIGIDLDNSRFGEKLNSLKLLTGDSKEIGRSYLGSSVDLLFIDGDHSYAGCRGDIAAWLPHMVVGSILAFHDSGAPQCEGVTRAISEWFASAVNWVELPKAGTLRSFKHVLPLAVLIPTYKRPEIVQRTVDLILSNLKYDGQVIVYVGDDSGNDDTKAALRGYPSTVVLESPKRGLGANLNFLLKASTEKLIVQMDDDHHLVAPLDIAAHVDKLNRDPLAGWIHLMINAKLNEHWDVSDFILHGDDLRHWRIMPESPCKFLASNQPHLKKRSVHTHYGMYKEGGKTWQQETEFNERVQAMHRATPDSSPRFYIPVEAYGFKYWRHVGNSYARRNL